jgi:lipid II:glycine glycyltransferase (peptidoglycan interpeptide bridge formation enzyme)
MAIEIVSEANLDTVQWAELTDSRFIVSPEFASVWRAKGGRPKFIISINNNRIKAGIAGIMFGRGRWRRFDSMPDGFYGGFYFDETLNEEQRNNFINEFAEYIKSQKVLRVLIHKSTFNIDDNSFKRFVHSAHVLKLNSEEYRPPRREVRKHIRGSKERGGRIEVFDRKDDLQRFCKLASITKKRHGQKPAYSFDFFERLWQVSMKDSRVLWLKVMLDDTMIASQISFIDRQEAFNWQFYYDKEYSFYKPGYLLLDYAINYAREHGVKIFCLGGTPGDAPGLTLYKERWGGEIVTYYSDAYYSGPGKLLHRCGVL